MKQVTVFGGSGFIGRHLVKRLAEKGFIVRVAVRDAAGANFLRPMGDVGQVTPVRADVRDDASVSAAIEGADAVVNLVGILFERGKRTFEAVHKDAAARIARQAKAAGVQCLVQMSALGASTRSPSRYAWSKAAGEDAVRAEFPEASILRPGVVFGPQDDFFNRFAAMAQLLPALPVFGGECPIYGRANAGPDDDGSRFQPVYVGDVADAIMACLERDDAAGKTYELGGPTVYTFRELMELVLRQTDRRCLLMPVPYWGASLMAFFLQFLPTPPLTPDQVTLLRSDNILSGDAPGLDALDIEPTAAEVIMPTYMDQYRRGGRFHVTVKA